MYMYPVIGADKTLSDFRKAQGLGLSPDRFEIEAREREEKIISAYD